MALIVAILYACELIQSKSERADYRDWRKPDVVQDSAEQTTQRCGAGRPVGGSVCAKRCMSARGTVFSASICARDPKIRNRSGIDEMERDETYMSRTEDDLGNDLVAELAAGHEGLLPALQMSQRQRMSVQSSACWDS